MSNDSVNELYNCAYALDHMNNMPNSKEKLECMLKMCDIIEKTLNVVKENLNYKLENYDTPLHPEFGTITGD